MTIYVQGHPVELKAFHDLSWVEGYGQVFRVVDSLSSGMLCFGVQGAQGRLFLKYAGAPCVNDPNSPHIAVERLRLAAERYMAVSHSAFVQMIHHQELKGGYLQIFRWEEGLPLSTLPETYQAFRSLPLLERLRLFDALIDLHVLTERAGLIIAGFKDSHLLFDAASRSLRLCSVDRYLPLPPVNLRGRLPGSPLYLAPEAYQPGVALDETCSVYALGALAHTFFGDRARQQARTWEAGPVLLRVVERAMQTDRGQRYQSVRALQEAWREAVLKSRF